MHILCIFSLTFCVLTGTMRGVSNKHCLLSLFSFKGVIANGLINWLRATYNANWDQWL